MTMPAQDPRFEDLSGYEPLEHNILPGEVGRAVGGETVACGPEGYVVRLDGMEDGWETISPRLARRLVALSRRRQAVERELTLSTYLREIQEEDHFTPLDEGDK